MINKGVMSFWSRGRKDPAQFLTASDVFMWAFSSYRLMRMFPNSTLVTDGIGRKIFQDLEIPFPEVRAELNDIIEPELSWIWAAGKIKAYSLFDEPFLHVDGDAFLNGQISDKTLQSDFIVENYERWEYKGKQTNGYNIDLYQNTFTNLKEVFRKRLYQERQLSYSFGVFGGVDTGYIRRYCSMVFEIIRDNKEALIEARRKTDGIGTTISMFLEQYTFPCLAQEYHLQVNELIRNWRIKGVKYDRFFDREFAHFPGPVKYSDNAQKLIRGALLYENRPLYDRCQKYIELNQLVDRPTHSISLHRNQQSG